MISDSDGPVMGSRRDLQNRKATCRQPSGRSAMLMNVAIDYSWLPAKQTTVALKVEYTLDPACVGFGHWGASCKGKISTTPWSEWPYTKNIYDNAPSSSDECGEHEPIFVRKKRTQKISCLLHNLNITVKCLWIHRENILPDYHDSNCLFEGSKKKQSKSKIR